MLCITDSQISVKFLQPLSFFVRLNRIQDEQTVRKRGKKTENKKIELSRN